MKKTMFRVSTLSIALVMVFSMAFALPVYADYVLPDWIPPKYGWLWDVVDRCVDVVTHDTRSWEQRDIFADPPPKELTTPKKYSTSGFGGTSGGRGNNPSSSSTSSGSTTSGGSSPSSSVTRNYTIYNGGNTTNTSIVNRTYNTTNNSYSYTLNMPTTTYNNTTNNYYETYNIDNNYYYNNEYNTYKYYVTNVTNHTYEYYVTYSPTYVNISYLDSSSGTSTAQSYTYFYELPDGRNTWDLTADEVFGMYFIYDPVNYDMVVEDEATLALYHFDGDLKDESTYNGQPTYLVGGSQNYVDHGIFGSALYWGNGTSALEIPVPTSFDAGGSGSQYTAEMMVYFSQPAFNFEFDSNSAQPLPYGVETSRSAFGSDMAKWPISEPRHFISGVTSTLMHGGGWWSHKMEGSDYVSTRTDTYMYRKVYSYLLCVEGTLLFPVMIEGKIEIERKVTCSGGYAYSSNGVQNFQKDNYSRISYFTKTFTVGGTISAPEDAVGIGEWLYLAAVKDGDTTRVYKNGILMESVVDAGNSRNICLAKPAEWGGYWYLDEFRLSAGALYDGNYITRTQPFDTNKVMVLPDSGDDGSIAVKSIVPVADLRVGGVRPTYPEVGDVYVNIEKKNDQHLAKVTEQYQVGGWVEVDSALRVEGEWVNMKNYDLRTYVTEPGDVPDPPDDGGDNSGDNSDSDSGGDNSGSGDPSKPGFWENIGNALGGLIKGILALVGQLAAGIVSLITGLFDALFSLVGFASNFGEFVGSAFAFIPAEITGVIVVGLSLAIILMIVNFFR